MQDLYKNPKLRPTRVRQPKTDNLIERVCKGYKGNMKALENNELIFDTKGDGKPAVIDSKGRRVPKTKKKKKNKKKGK